MRSAREIVAKNMRTLRSERGLTQEALALETGLHRTFVAHVETANRNISIDNLEKIAVAFGISVSKLLADDN